MCCIEMLKLTAIYYYGTPISSLNIQGVYAYIVYSHRLCSFTKKLNHRTITGFYENIIVMYSEKKK